MNRLLITGGGGIAVPVSFGSNAATTPACVVAMLNSAFGLQQSQGVSASIVAGHPTVRRRPFNHFAITEDSPNARQHHASGCRWKTGKNGERRGWCCADTCSIPELLAREASQDE